VKDDTGEGYYFFGQFLDVSLGIFVCPFFVSMARRCGRRERFRNGGCKKGLI
jgi:hypothetical protein